MSINYYKLVGYKPFWIQDDDNVPKSHIEEILQNVSFNNKRSIKQLKRLTRAMSNKEHWIPTKNYQWTNVWTLKATGTLEDIADYIKVDVNGNIYYYYLINKTETILASKDGESYFDATYNFDEYMSAYWNKLKILREHNPYVYVNMGFTDRWSKRYDAKRNLTYYEFNFIDQKNIGNTMSDRNIMKVRKQAYHTTQADLFSINFPNLTIPQTYELTKYGTNTTKEFTNWQSLMVSANSTGRYKYIIAKSTALAKCDNDKILAANTSQDLVVIPLFSATIDQTLHALNDFSLTRETTATDPYLLNPLASANIVGIYDCDIPYSYWYGLVASNLYGAKAYYIDNFDDAGTVLASIPFFTFHANAPMLIKIIDYTRYIEGFYGKFYHIITNIYNWLPDTEPLFLNPMYYTEEFNNGEGKITLDSSMFNFKWNSDAINVFEIQAYLSWSKDLVVAYNFGQDTNTELVAFDNTETSLGKASITSFIVGSASADYYSTNVNTLSTGLQNRQSEEAQAWVDASLSSAQAWNNAAPTSAIPWKAAAQAIKGGVNAALETAKIMTDTAMTQQRANRSFNSSINNITSSPSITLSDPSIKGCIPNKNGLFDTYSYEICSYDKDVLFNHLLNRGYALNYMMLLNDVLDNRKFMNILNINTEYNKDELVKILSENDTSIFNTKFWNVKFLAWMNQGLHIYSTDRLVNCTDYMGEGYVSNIENVLPDVPIPKENIARFLNNFRLEYEANEDFILQALVDDHPDAPDDLWDNIYISELDFGGFTIHAFEASDEWYGDIVVNTTCYNGYILDNEIKHYFWDVDFLCVPTNIAADDFIINCPDGTQFNNMTFNSKIIFIDNGKITSIGNRFLEGTFINNDYSLFNQDITLPNTITHIGYSFLRDRGNMTSVIDFRDIPASSFDLTKDTSVLQTPSSLLLSQYNDISKIPINWNNVPAYLDGVKLKGTYVDDIKNVLLNGTYSGGSYYYGARNLVKVEE